MFYPIEISFYDPPTTQKGLQYEEQHGTDPKLSILYFDCPDDHAKWIDKLRKVTGSYDIEEFYTLSKGKNYWKSIQLKHLNRSIIHSIEKGLYSSPVIKKQSCDRLEENKIDILKEYDWWNPPEW